MARWKPDPNKQLGTTATGPMTVKGSYVVDKFPINERGSVQGDLFIQERAMRQVPERLRCPECLGYVETLPTMEAPCGACGGPVPAKRGR